jgi:hypothetical protein
MRAILKWVRWRGILILAALTPPCRKITALASRDYEKPIGLGIRLRIKIHTQICVACRRYLTQLEFLHKAGGQLGEVGLPSERQSRLRAEARERIKHQLRCEQAK